MRPLDWVDLNTGDLILVDEPHLRLLGVIVGTDDAKDVAVLRTMIVRSGVTVPSLVPIDQFSGMAVRKLDGRFSIEPAEPRCEHVLSPASNRSSGGLAVQGQTICLIVATGRGMMQFDIRSGERVNATEPLMYLSGWVLKWWEGEDAVELHEFA
jgi:hypothetical protein